MRILDGVIISYWLTDWCKEANLQPHRVQYNIDRENIKVNIYTPYPGWLIGPKGNRIEKYMQLLIEEEKKHKCEKHLEINLIETTQADFWVDYDYMGEGF